MAKKKKMTKEQREEAAYVKMMNAPVKMFQLQNAMKNIEGLFKLTRDFLDSKYPGEFDIFVEELEEKAKLKQEEENKERVENLYARMEEIEGLIAKGEETPGMDAERDNIEAYLKTLPYTFDPDSGEVVKIEEEEEENG